MGYSHGLPIFRSLGQTWEEAKKERQVQNMRALRLRRKGRAEESDFIPSEIPAVKPKKRNNILDFTKIRG